MKTGCNFFAGLAAGFLLAMGITGGAFYLNLGVHSVTSKWTFDITQKKRLLARQTQPPRLLLVGGSATLFGLSARELERQTGCRTLNLGTHAALGTAYLLRETRQLAKPGDTVLLVLEYELYYSGILTPRGTDPLLVDYIVARAPDFFRDLSLIEQWNVFMLTPNQRLIQGLKNRKRREAPEQSAAVYSVNRINDWGDQMGHTEAERARHAGSSKYRASFFGREVDKQPVGFPVIADFCAWAKTNQVRVLATFPNLMDDPSYHNAVARQRVAQIAAFYSALGVPVVGDYTETLLSADQFFDTIYHLTEKAAAERTCRLAAELKPCLQELRQAVSVR